MTETVYTLEDLEKILKVGRRTIRGYVKSGELRASRVGKRYLVTERQLTRFFADHRTEMVGLHQGGPRG
jgi:excisionase family DNA binding protein